MNMAFFQQLREKGTSDDLLLGVTLEWVTENAITSCPKRFRH